MTDVSDQTQDVSTLDRDWFERHPGVVTRWRPYVRGEAGPAAEQELRVQAADAEREGLEAQLVVKVTRLTADCRARHFEVVTRPRAELVARS